MIFLPDIKPASQTLGTLKPSLEKFKNTNKTKFFLLMVISLAQIYFFRKLYEDPETWSTQQELLRLFRKILISDLDYALEKKVLLYFEIVAGWLPKFCEMSLEFIYLVGYAIL